jgi:diguanylate cyclase (GGDEF)-like protein/PAS domain S-box-containing protein
MRTARARTLLGITVLSALLGALVVMAGIRVRSDRSARHAVAQQEAVVASLEDARVTLHGEASSAMAALDATDPSVFVPAYQQSRASADDALAQARGSLIEIGGSAAGSALEAFTLSLNYLRQDIDSALGPAGGNQHSPVVAGKEYVLQLEPRFDQALIELDRLIAAQNVQLTALRDKATNSSDVTLALLLGWSTIAFLVGGTVLTVIIVSFTRPLSALRLRLSELLAGNGRSGAPVYGPEEVTALAHNVDCLVERQQRAEKALRASENKYNALFKRSIDAVYVHDLDGKFVDANDATLEMLGCSREELIGSPVVDFFEAPRRPAVVAAMNDVIDSGRGELRTFRLKRRDGATVDLEVAASLVRNENGDAFVLAVARDVSYRVRAEEVLRGSEDKYRDIFENVQDIVYRTDALGVITEIGPAVQRWGYQRQDLIGTNVLDVYVDPDERKGLMRELLARNEVTDYEIKLRAADGSIRYSSVGSHIIRDAEGAMIGVEGVLRDVTERKNAEEALREQMRRDPLTGVLNHAAIVDELRRLLSHNTNGSYCAVLISDVDGLKAINDTFGHAVGDQVLVSVAELLSRDSAIVGRYGGDEFITVLPLASHEEAERYKEGFLSALADAVPWDDSNASRIPVLVSTGIAIYPLEGTRIEELIQLADSAMYAEKRRRREAATGLPPSRHRGGDLDAARIVGEIVPFLTTTGNLDEKLRLVARRLSVAGGYDAVSFSLFDSEPKAPPKMIAFTANPQGLVKEWRRAGHQLIKRGTKGLLDSRHDRAQIVNDLSKSPLYSATSRDLMEKSGLKSGMSAPMRWHGELIGLLAVASRRENAFTPADAQVLSAVASQVTAIVSLQRLVDELQAASGRLNTAHIETVMLLAAAAEAHDRTTGKHLKNVQRISEQLALELGFSKEDARDLGLAAVLHDIGKIRVADSVLANKGRLTAEEWELMQQHAVWGEQFLAGRSGFQLAARIARSHHERWDATGYPDGLKAEQIPEVATIVSVADSFDAMTSDRHYKPGRSAAAAMKEIMACSGAQFSPNVVQALIRLYKQQKLPRRRPRHLLDERQAA